MTCPLCYHNARFFLEGEQREYWICPQCELIFVPPQYFLSRNDEINRYLEHENSLENQGYVDMFQKKIRILREICPQGCTVLDYGCGYAPVLKTLLEREGYEAHVYDPHFFPRETLHSKYDLIISTETFEHFQEPGRELKKLMGRMGPSGYLAVMTRFYPLKENVVCREAFGTWYYKRDPTHVAFYSTATFDWIGRTFHFNIVFSNKNDFIILQSRSDSKITT